MIYPVLAVGLPGVIVSNDGANTTASRLGRGVVTIVPVTSNVERVYPFQVLLRVGERIGSLASTDLAALDEASRIHLAL